MAGAGRDVGLADMNPALSDIPCMCPTPSSRIYLLPVLIPSIGTAARDGNDLLHAVSAPTVSQ